MVTPPRPVPSPISTFLGLVTYLTEVELHRGEPEIFVAAARGPYMEVLGYPTGNTLVGSGAGLRWEDARGAAVGECLERYAASVVEGEHLVLASYEGLRRSGRQAHDPSAWALFDPTQQVPYPTFSQDRVIAWTRGWDLRTNDPVFLPACFAYLSSNPILADSDAEVIGPAVSTGCACATSTDESLLKGLCELVERDAFMIVWRSRLAIPEIIIDEGSALNPIYKARFARPGLEYRIWQTTLDFSLPSFFGILFDRRGPKTRMIVGGAAHPDAQRAVQKTLCELIQGLTWLDYMGDHPDPRSTDFADIRNFTDRALLYALHPLPEAYSFLFHDRAKVPLSSIPSRRAPIPELLQAVVDETVAKGFQPSAIDLTTDDVRACGYVVTRVMVPGLETMDGDHRLQMLGGRRWRQIPVDLGLVSNAPTIETLNPFPHPYP